MIGPLKTLKTLKTLKDYIYTFGTEMHYRI
jgi:hypothetical protein